MLKFFVLDNQAVARNLLSSILLQGGHQVLGDSNISVVNLARIAKLQPQVLCVDLGDFNKEALTLLDSLREQLPKALVFVVAARIDADFITQCQEHGVNGFIVKPFNAAAVLSSIRNTIIRLAKQPRT
jgi:two-component system chemotaxis response regulator CheY